MMVNLLILSLIASLMVAIIVLILYYIEKIRTYVGVFFIYFSLIMMITMFLGASIYLYSPSNLTLAIAFAINMSIMIVLIVYFFIIAKKLIHKPFNGEKPHVVVFSFLVVLNEILMGSTFGIAQFGSEYFSTPYNAFYYSINSYWFFYPMMAEMLAFYIIHYIRGLQYKELLPLIGIAAFPPTVFNYPNWFYSALIFSLIFSVLGVLSSRKYIYLALAITILLNFVNAIPYDILIIASMTWYYSQILSITLKH
ncbi:MAG: hypothetical protein QW685_10035 [Saccharolobus sp.]